MSTRSLVQAAVIAFACVSVWGTATPPVSAQTAQKHANPALPGLFAAEVERSRAFVGEMMAAGVRVPIPKDPGGGDTHEQHKRNYRAIAEAGELYRLTGDRTYATFVRDMLVAYADLYPTLGPHPARANQHPGRLFWQSLNDAVWLVNSIQGYAHIRATLTEADRAHIDTDLFRNAAAFMSVESAANFDRIHNHATWSTAGVGITGYVLGDPDLVQRALLGSKKDGKAGFLNIEAKQGGRYLPENETWAKQSMAHNTLVVDGKSHFDSDQKRADALAPTQLHFAAGPEFSVSVGTIDGAYQNVAMTRTLAMVAIRGLERPVVVDLFRVRSQAPHRYDLPLHYEGHIIRVGPKLTSHVAARPVLGDGHGYQHVWVDAEATPDAGNAFVTWQLGNRFYTWRWVPTGNATMMLAESGANDPEFNLRREPILIQRLDGATDALFVGVLESHGRYDGAAEQTVASDSQIRSVTAGSGEGADAAVIETLAGERVVVATAYDPDPRKAHEVTVGGDRISWTGPAARIDLTRRTK